MKENIKDMTVGGELTLNDEPAKPMTLAELLAGVTDEEAAKAAKGAPPGGPRRPQAPVTFVDLDAPGPLIPVVEPRRVTPDIERGVVQVIASDPGTGKSLLAVATAMAVSRDMPTTIGLAEFSYPGATIYISNEDSPQVVERRRQAWLRGHGIDPTKASRGLYLAEQGADLVVLVEAVAKGAPQLNLAVVEALEEKITELRNYDIDVAMVIIDTMLTALSGIDENDNSAMGAAMALLGKWAKWMDVAVVLLAHISKATGRVGIGRLRGASATGGSIRSGVELKRLPEEDEARLKDPRERGRWFYSIGLKANYSLRAQRQWYFVQSDQLPTVAKQRNGFLTPSITDTAWVEVRKTGPFPPFDPNSVLVHADVLTVLLEGEAAGKLVTASLAGRNPSCIGPVFREALEDPDGEGPTLKQAREVAKALFDAGYLRERDVTAQEKAASGNRHDRRVVEVTQKGRDLVDNTGVSAGVSEP